MTLDDDRVGWREAERRDRERESLEEYRDRELCESVEAVEAHWRGVFRGMRAHWSASQHWSGTS